MTSILIKNVLHNQKITDVLIQEQNIVKIAPNQNCQVDKVIDGTEKLIAPAFYNTHTHHPMAILRGYADDLELFPWLSEHIWPAEAQMTTEDVYQGTRLAILESLKSGCVFFNDMYWQGIATCRAAEEMHVRACITPCFINAQSKTILPKCWEEFHQVVDYVKTHQCQLIQIGIGPHAIYTVNPENLKLLANYAKENNFLIHVHASETQKEVEDSYAAYGCSPIEHLQNCGMLGKNTILAHAVHLNEKDIQIIKETHSIISHNPTSNMKLVSGLFPFHEVAEIQNCRVTIGTDGAASNNNLSMLEEIKIAALSAKIQSQNPTAGKAENIYHCATQAAAEAFNINAGIIEEGKLADVILIDLHHPQMNVCHNLISNLVYSADTSCVHTVICNGKILIENYRHPQEDEIIQAARTACDKMLARIKAAQA